MRADIRFENPHLETGRLCLMLFVSGDLLDIVARAVKEWVFVFITGGIDSPHVLYNCRATVPQILGNRVEYRLRPLAKRAGDVDDIGGISGSDRRYGCLGPFPELPGGLGNASTIFSEKRREGSRGPVFEGCTYLGKSRYFPSNRTDRGFGLITEGLGGFANRA